MLSYSYAFFIYTESKSYYASRGEADLVSGVLYSPDKSFYMSLTAFSASAMVFIKSKFGSVYWLKSLKSLLSLRPLTLFNNSNAVMFCFIKKLK